MGLRRACHGALGRAAVRLPLLLAAIPLAGCGTIGAIGGAVAGASTGAATANPIVGYATAVAVNAGIDELQNYIARVRDGAEQDVIAQAVGDMHPGETRPWRIVHTIPLFDDEHGEMQVTRTIDTPLTQCKEVVFSVDSGAPVRHVLYTTDACRNASGWKWAAAEPAVPRWGGFQRISY